MSLKSKLQSQLNRRSMGGPQRIVVEDGALRLTCDLVDVHPLACQFERLAVATAQLAEASPDQLQALSDRLAARITYLLEPISPIEHDDEGCVIQLRSNPPQKEDDGTRYYELVVRRGGELALCRYQKQPGQVRQVIPATVTQEVLLRLVGDFESVLI